VLCNLCKASPPLLNRSFSLAWLDPLCGILILHLYPLQVSSIYLDELVSFISLELMCKCSF
uniref:Uncharacterized protein n=1 Tax=Oryza brachyantha TaxID=4533 RepID=J3NA63_ORYBR